MTENKNRMLDRIIKNFIPTNWKESQKEIVTKSCNYILEHISSLIDLLEWEVEDNKISSQTTFLGNFTISYSYESCRFEVYWDGAFVAEKSSIVAAKYAANDLYRTRICSILGL